MVVVCAYAKHPRSLIKQQAMDRDDGVKGDEGQLGFGVEVHLYPLFCCWSWRQVAVLLRPLDHDPDIERRPRHGRDLVGPVPEQHR